MTEMTQQHSNDWYASLEPHGEMVKRIVRLYADLNGKKAPPELDARCFIGAGQYATALGLNVVTRAESDVDDAELPYLEDNLRIITVVTVLDMIERAQLRYFRLVG